MNENNNKLKKKTELNVGIINTHIEYYLMCGQRERARNSGTKGREAERHCAKLSKF